MSCSTSLDQDYTLAGALDHGCKEKLGGKEKDHQDALNGSDRGKRYQICPTCRRFCQLAEACHHINCPCGEQFCYKCGERATADSGHWSSMRRTPAGHCPQYPRPGPVEAAVDDDTQQRYRPAHQFPIDENLRLGIYRGPILTQAEIDQGARERLWDLRLMNGRVRRVDQAARNRLANEQHPANDRQVPAAPADGQLEQEVRERLQRYRDAPPRPVSPVEDELDRSARERLDRYRLAHDQDGAIGDAAARQPRLTQNRQFWLAMGRQNRTAAWGALLNPHAVERDLEQQLEDAEEAYEAARDEAERDLEGRRR